MIRIIHLSDFHFNKKNQKDWQDYIKDALGKKLNALSRKTPINIIAFTGDLIDQGGKELGGATSAFEIFKKEVIDYLCSDLGLSMNEFLIVPGNHDIERNKDEERMEMGNVEFFKKSIDNISSIMSKSLKENDFAGMERIRAYKDFERKLYENIPNSEFTIFGNSFKLNISNKSIGVACLNSAWRCYDKLDLGKLIVGEVQLVKNYKYIDKCDLKIALLHHPLDWLIENEAKVITNHITKDFDLLLLGHVHEGDTSMTIGFNGKLFINIAPSTLNDIRNDSRRYSNGFTIIDIEMGKEKTVENIYCEYWRYNHDKKEYVLNTDLGDNGKCSHKIPDEKSKKKTNLEISIIENIKEDHFDKMDKHLIGTNVIQNLNTCIKKAFVLPPINQGLGIDDNENEDNLNINEILKIKSNLMFFGDQESGKTTLLYRLVREYVDEFLLIKKVPVYINFQDLRSKDIITLIKEYLRCSSDDAKALISEKTIVLLIDNLDFKKGSYSDQMSRIYNFFRQNEEIQIIATGTNLTTGILPSEYIELCKIPFRNYFIRNLGVKEIKSVMKQWIPNESELNSDLRLERLVNSFRSYVLPSSVMSVSLFLWSMEYSEKKPINNAVLMEIYIEILLEKLGKHNIYRENFDFTNKMQLLAKIAHEMSFSLEPNYSIHFSLFEKIVEDYLNEVGFSFDANKIVEYFLERKIFSKHQNIIKFSYSCFYYFFIAKRMMFNGDFRSEILCEENYFKHIKVIDYYSGLSRSDESLLQTMTERLDKAFKGTEFVLEQVNIDQYFTYQNKEDIELKKEHEPLIKKIEIVDIPKNRPSKEKLELFLNKRLEDIQTPDSIKKHDGENSLEGMLILSAIVLRNSEGVENRILKRKAYELQIKHSLTWMILYREYLISYVKNNKNLPASISTIQEFMFLIKNLPFAIQAGLNTHMGSPKLAPIVLEKLNEDMLSKSSSDVERFLSVGLYADIEGKDFPKYLKSFVKVVGKNVVRDYMLLKLLNFYYKRTRTGSPNEKIYLDLLAELKIKTKNMPHRIKDRVVKALIDGKESFKTG